MGNDHKVKLGKKRSKTNSIELGKMASGLCVVFPGAICLPRCYVPQVLLTEYIPAEISVSL